MAVDITLRKKEASGDHYVTYIFCSIKMTNQDFSENCSCDNQSINQLLIIKWSLLIKSLSQLINLFERMQYVVENGNVIFIGSNLCDVCDANCFG